MSSFNDVLLEAKNISDDYPNDPNSHMKGGKLIVDSLIKNCGEGLEHYVKMGKYRLNENVINHLNENYDFYNNLLISTVQLNYKYVDTFSASTYTNLYLLNAVLGECVFETPTQMFLRIAVHEFMPDINKVKEMYLIYANRMCTPASPTLMNAGTDKPQCSSCFLGRADDNLENILVSLVDTGLISKAKGAFGLDISQLRHSEISGAGMSKGVKAFCETQDKLIKYVDQTGKRSGAATVHLQMWHYDALTMIQSTSNINSQTEKLHKLNVCMWLHDLFMRRYLNGDNWTVFCPLKSGLYGLYGKEFETKYLELEKLAEIRQNYFDKIKTKLEKAEKQIYLSDKIDEKLQTERDEILKEYISAKNNLINCQKYNAKDLMIEIAKSEISSSFPFVMYGDKINSCSNQANIGKVNSSNLCIEITEVCDSKRIASCNLHSINLKEFALKPFPKDVQTEEEIFKIASEYYDFSNLAKTSRECVNALNQIIDRNYYPIEEKTKQHNLDTRPLGIGVSGLDDVFKILDLEYGSITRAFNKIIFACIYYNCLYQSHKLSQVDGSYKYFDTDCFELESVNENPNYDRKPLNTVKLDDGIFNHTFEGSPFFNGILQFDLWKERALVMKKRGELFEDVYSLDDDEPVKPIYFGEKESWENLKHLVSLGMRNSLLTTCMPTASTSQILLNQQSTEPQVSNINVRMTKCGAFTVLNQHLVKDLTDLGIYNPTTIKYLIAFNGDMIHFPRFITERFRFYPNLDREKKIRIKFLVRKYKTAYDISQKEIMLMARQRGIYIDQTQSMNMFLKDATIRRVMAIHKYGFKLGLKTGMYYLVQPKENSDFTIDADMREFMDMVGWKTGNSKVDLSTSGGSPLGSPLGMSCPIDLNEREECLACS